MQTLDAGSCHKLAETRRKLLSQELLQNCLVLVQASTLKTGECLRARKNINTGIAIGGPSIPTKIFIFQEFSCLVKILSRLITGKPRIQKRSQKLKSSSVNNPMKTI